MKRRPPGSGTVYLPTKHAKVWHIAYRVAGHTVRESSGSRAKADAEQLLRARVATRDRGTPPPPNVVLTVAGLGALVISDLRANGRKAIDDFERHVARLCSALGASTPARNVDEVLIARYISTRQAEGGAAGTINLELATLRRGFVLAVDSRRLERRPKIKLLRLDNVRKGFVEPDQLPAILAELPPPLRAVVEVAYETGWRVASELLTRQWHHVDMASGWLRLEPGETKNRRGRNFPFTPALRRALEAQRAATDAFEREYGRTVPWVFHRGGKPIRSFHVAWRSACERAGVPGKLLHDFRRTAVRNLERAGVSRSAAMAMVGHETESIYRRYAIADEALLLEAAVKLGRLRD